MARNRIVKSIKNIAIKDIVLVKDLYPRENWNFQTAYGYSQAMLAGAKFPPITVALDKGRYTLVDGKHRIEAKKILKLKDIEAEVIVGWSPKDIFEEAVRINSAHGKTLTVFEKRNIALKLRNWKYSPNQISELISVPVSKLNNFISQNLVSAITGQVIVQGNKQVPETVPMIVKSGIKNAVNQTSVDVNTIDSVQSSVYAGSQFSLLKQLIKIIEGGFLDTSDKEVNKLVVKLKSLLENL